jgi:alpha-acetolactate decarboxylase
MLMNRLLVVGVVLLLGMVAARSVAAAEGDSWDGRIVQYGKMHEAIGQQQHQGRVHFQKVVEQPHFYGVAALAQLKGEATILDGNLTITRVDAKGQLAPSEAARPDESATLLVGAYVPSWSARPVPRDVIPDEFDAYLADEAAQAGLNATKPFVFTVEGEFRNIRFHVINGACPLHARLKKIDLAPERRPFEGELEKVRGTLVGVFAKDAVGDITHPATSTHMHLLFKDARTGQVVTGHVEQVGLMKGAVVRLPKMK